MRSCRTGTSEAGEQILAVKFEDGSGYGTKEELEEAKQQRISPSDIELPDVEVRDQEQVRKMLVEFEDMWQW